MRVKHVAAGVGLFGFGALLSWAVTADYWERKTKLNNERLLEMLRKSEETVEFLTGTLVQNDLSVMSNMNSVDRLKATASKLDDGTSEIVLNPNSEKSPGGVSDETEEGWEEITHVEPVPQHEVGPRLRALISEYNNNPDDHDQFVDMAARAIEVSDDPPFVISQEVYAYDEEGQNYEKITLYYYPSANILLDDEEEIEEEIDLHVGMPNLNRFGDESGDPNVVFIRNRKLCVDYEVVREEGDPPIHAQYRMTKEQYNTSVAAGIIKPSRSRGK